MSQGHLPCIFTYDVFCLLMRCSTFINWPTTRQVGEGERGRDGREESGHRERAREGRTGEHAQGGTGGRGAAGRGRTKETAQAHKWSPSNSISDREANMRRFSDVPEHEVSRRGSTCFKWEAQSVPMEWPSAKTSYLATRTGHTGRLDVTWTHCRDYIISESSLVCNMGKW